MPIRCQASTRVWTCRKTTDEASFASSRAYSEGGGVFNLPGAGLRADMERLPRAAGCESCGCDHSFHGKVDAYLSSHHPQRDSTSETHEFALASPFSPHAGPVCFFLRHAPPDHLPMAGQVLSLPRDAA